MTTGEYLLSKSSLNSGTALAHLLALQTGTGQGTVFAAMFSVSVEQPSITVTQRAKRPMPEIVPAVRPAATKSPGKRPGSITIHTAQEEVSVQTVDNDLMLTSRTEAVAIVTRLSSETVTRKRKH